VHEVITNQEGKLDDKVHVNSSADIYVYSLEQDVFGFFKIGSARAFESEPIIVGTPRVDVAGACLSLANGTPVVEVKYNLTDITRDEIGIDITSLHDDLYRNPSYIQDDLTVNTIIDSTGNYVLPDASHIRAGQQLFDLTGTFTVPWIPSKAPYFGTLLGKSFAIDGNAPICEGAGLLLCDPIPTSHFDTIENEVRVVMSNYLKLMRRLGSRTERARNIRKSAARYYRQTVNLVSMLAPAYTCPVDQLIPPECYRAIFPEKPLLAEIDIMFRKGSRNAQRASSRLGKRSRKRLRRIIKQLFPTEFWICPD
jgi:hypothetical protein